jgi:hypothetical protein
MKNGIGRRIGCQDEYRVGCDQSLMNYSEIFWCARKKYLDSWFIVLICKDILRRCLIFSAMFLGI